MSAQRDSRARARSSLVSPASDPTLREAFLANLARLNELGRRAAAAQRAELEQLAEQARVESCVTRALDLVEGRARPPVLLPRRQR